MSSVKLTKQLITQVCALGSPTSSQILTSLQSAYPATTWTTSVLANYIDTSLQQGRLEIASSTPVRRYRINIRMVQVFPQNIKYQNLCSSIQKLYPCQTISTGSYAGFLGPSCP